jgi:hypothetical protein
MKDILPKKHTSGTLELHFFFMPTTKPRLNLTLPKHVALHLKKISLRDEVPQATIAVQLLERALEWEEGEFKQSFVDEIRRREKEDALIPFEEVLKKLW